MSRRSPRQSVTDDLAFPIRLKLVVPPLGFGNDLNTMLRWLKAEVGPGNYAQHSGQTLGGDAISVHFRRPEDLVRFLEAFPFLELADATTSRAYTSPLRPETSG